ncbi:MAG: Efflux ABC transporter permease protein [Promethearchaeota archaeon CR_4]|nr:MAG: Efflux ABC transporter permease protein [Candidatus Lokiarchaeota archaeon CR_4]
MSVDFAMKDIIRNRQVSKPFIVSIAASVSIIVFELGFSKLFNAIINETEIPIFSSGFNAVFEQFNLMLLILLTILPITVLIFSLYAWVGHKKRDIATMKTIGTFPAKLYNFFLIELLLITLIGYCLGFLFGGGAYLVVFIVLEEMGTTAPFQVDFVWNLVVFGSLLVTTYVVGGVHLRKIAGTLTVAETLAGDIPRTTFAGSRANVLLRGLSRLGTSLKVAIRNIIRRSHDFRRTFAILATCGTIIFVSVLGTISLRTSIRGYASGTISENTIVVGHSTILPYFNRLYAQFSDPDQVVKEGDINFSLPQFFFNESILPILSSINGVVRVDPRVCLLEHFYERGTYFNAGQGREGSAIVMGINSSLMEGSYTQEGSFVGPNDNESITIGDSIAYDFFDNYTEESIAIHGKQFKMIGMVLDTLYNGQSIYMGIQGVWKYWPDLAGKNNILLLQVNPDNFETVKNAIAIVVHSELGEDFDVIDLRSTLQNNQAALDTAQFYFIIVTVATIVIASLSLVEYQRGASTLKARDLRIMRAVGAKRGFLMESLYWENFLLTIPSFGLAMGIGMIFVEFFLVAKLELLPPLWIPLAIGALMLGIFAIANLAISVNLFQRSRGLPDDLER